MRKSTARDFKILTDKLVEALTDPVEEEEEEDPKTVYFSFLFFFFFLVLLS